MGKNSNFKNKTTDILNSMKGIKTVEEINKEITDIDNKIRSINGKLAKNRRQRKDLTENKEPNEASKKIFNDLIKDNRNLQNEKNSAVEAKKKKEEEKKEIDKKFAEVEDFKTKLFEMKEKIEKRIAEEKDKYTKNSKKIIEILKEINSNDKLSTEEIKLKKEEVKKLKSDRISKEDFKKLLVEKEEIKECIEKIERFQADPKKFFEKEAQREGDNSSKPKDPNNRRKPNKPPVRGNGGNKPPVQGDGENNSPAQGNGGNNTSSRGNGGNNSPVRGNGGNNTSSRGNGGNNSPVQGDEENNSPVQDNGENNPTEYETEEGVGSGNTEQTSPIKLIEYDGRNNRYIYTYENGQQQVVPKEMFLVRLQEQIRLYRRYRDRGCSRLKSLKTILRYDPNITKHLRGNREELKKYSKYVAGEDNELVSYSFTVGLLKDIGLRNCARLRKNLIISRQGNGDQPTQGQPEQQPTQPPRPTLKDKRKKFVDDLVNGFNTGVEKARARSQSRRDLTNFRNNGATNSEHSNEGTEPADD